MSDTVNHPDDDLEAYALGMLEPDERVAVDAHVRSCDACATRLGEAERTVTTMLETMLPADRMPRRGRAPRPLPSTGRTAWSLRFATAAAAVFALTTGLLGAQYASLHAAARSDGALMHAMIATHFVHSQFRSPSGEPLDAKVLYERHGRWYAVLVVDSGPAYRVATVERSGAVPHILSQEFVHSGGVATMRFPAVHALAAMELLDGAGGVVGTAATPQSGGR